jgi:hypothetical protein
VSYTLNLGLDIVDGVGRLHLKGDGFARKGLHKDLHLGLYCERSAVARSLGELCIHSPTQTLRSLAKRSSCGEVSS